MFWWLEDDVKVIDLCDGRPMVLGWTDSVGRAWLAYACDQSVTAQTYLVKSTTPERLEAFEQSLVDYHSILTESCSGKVYVLTLLDEGGVEVDTLPAGDPGYQDLLPARGVYLAYVEDLP